MKMKKTPEWPEELVEVWDDESMTKEQIAEYILQQWPTHASWKQFQLEGKQDRKRWDILRKIKRSFFDEDEFERLIKRFAKNDIAARRKVFSLLDGKNERKVCVDAINNDRYLYLEPDEKKVIRTFRQLLKSKAFRKEMGRIRTKLSIPAKGCVWSPDGLEPFEDTPLYDHIYTLMVGITEKFQIDESLASALMYHLVYDRIPVDTVHLFHSLCYIENVMYAEMPKKAGYYSEDKKEDAYQRKRARVDEARMRQRYPIAIRISPYARISDIQQFIAARARRLEGELEPYKSKTGIEIEIGKVRKRLAGKKHDFIWANQHVKPAKKLAVVVNKKFQTDHDAIYIRNMISRFNAARGKP